MSKANGGNPSGKVRPAWMEGPRHEEEQAPEETANTAPGQDTEDTAEESRTAGQATDTPEPAENTAAPDAQRANAKTNAEAKPGAARLHPVLLDSRSESQASGHEVGRESAEAYIETPDGSPSGSPSGPPRSGWREVFAAIKTALSHGLFAGETGSAQSSPEELESRLTRALRETRIKNGFARICVGSPKGGVGKSSLAYTVAAALAYCTNLKVVLVDADPNFGTSRPLLPQPVDASVLDLARDAGEVESFADLEAYLAQNNQMRLDAVLRPKHAYELAEVDDLGEVYARVDGVLSRHYHVAVYDLGLGFSDPAIRRVLTLCNELVLITDSEVISNSLLGEAVAYVERLGISRQSRTLAINHRLPKEHESARTAEIREAAKGDFRWVTEIPYDAALSQLLNHGSFHLEDLELDTRFGVLTAAATALEGLRANAQTPKPANAKANAKANASKATVLKVKESGHEDTSK